MKVLIKSAFALTAILSYSPVIGQCNKPVITLQPTSVVKCEGTVTSTFTTSATGATTYQWYWNGSTPTGTVVPPTYPWSGTTTPTLSIAIASSTTAKNY